MAKKIDSTFHIDKGRLSSNSPKISALATESMHDLWIRVQCKTTGTTAIVNDFSRPILLGSSGNASIVFPGTTSPQYNVNAVVYIYIYSQAERRVA